MEKIVESECIKYMGHIPAEESTKIEILTFECARQHREDSAVYDRNRWMYVPDFYSEYRYILGTKGNRPLITIGINPSTAEPDHLDNTLKSVERLALRNGFDSFIMFNVYAQRATNPDLMDTIFNEKLHQENMKAFRYVLEQAGEHPCVWAAWGTIIEKRGYLKKCLEEMISIGKEYQVRWLKTGKVSKKGHPHHPLYLAKESVFDTFEIDNYCNDLW